MSTKRDYYDVLGIPKSAGTADIKKAYRKQALEFHPDRNKSSDAEAKFKEVNEAYEILSNPQKKQTYDQFGHSAFDPASGAGGFGGFSGTRTNRSGPFSFSYTTTGGPGGFNQFDFSDPFEIFESFFGGSGFRRGPQKPRYSLTIDFLEAAQGTKRTIVHQGKSHTVNIPAGVDNGTRIRFQDFDVSVDVHIHPEFQRDGYNIIIDYDIPFTTAALGANIEVPTIEAPIKLKVRPGTQPGTIIRLRGKGIKHLHGGGRGDQYVRLIITIPKHLNREQRKLLQKFQETQN